MSAPPDVRFVIFHAPGPGWQHGKPIREQPGVQDHVAHYRQLHASGKLAQGGPFLDDGAGGMMVPVAGQDEQEIRAYAAADPAVQSGLLTFTVRPWMIGMQGA